MKWQWIIWAVYLVVISFVPCSEGDEPCVAQASIVQYEPSSTAGDDCTGDHCSPFCCCFCCQVQCSAEIFSQPTVPVIPVNTSFNTVYNASFHPVHCGNIWQPPRIAAA